MEFGVEILLTMLCLKIDRATVFDLCKTVSMQPTNRQTAWLCLPVCLYYYASVCSLPSSSSAIPLYLINLEGTGPVQLSCCLAVNDDGIPRSTQQLSQRHKRVWFESSIEPEPAYSWNKQRYRWELMNYAFIWVAKVKAITDDIFPSKAIGYFSRF